MNIIEHLKKEAKRRGVELVEKPHGHFQLKGPLLVNYYPLSQNRCAYVAGTSKGKKYVDPAQAVAMALKPPEFQAGAKRPKNTRRLRIKLFRKIKSCHWCRQPVTVETSTLEHIVPLARGGLNNFNNLTLACEACNQGRGHSMPELKKEK